jgi:hypothetical protein
MYVAESDSPDQNRNYLTIGIVGLVLIVGLIFVAKAVS